MGKEAPNFSAVAPPGTLSSPMDIMQMLREAFYVSTKSWKSMLATALVALALCVLLLLGARFSTSPLMALAMDLYLLHAQSPASPRRLELVAAAERDAWAATAKELVFLAISFLTSWISSVAAFCVHDAASNAGNQPASEKTARGRRMRGSLATLRCIAGLTVGYAFFLEALVLVLLAVAGGSAGFIVLGVLLPSAARMLSFSMGMFWGQGLAISMLDDEGCCGMEALRRPVQLLLGLPAPQPEELPV